MENPNLLEILNNIGLVAFFGSLLTLPLTHTFITQKLDSIFEMHKNLTPIQIPISEQIIRGYLYCYFIYFYSENTRNKRFSDIIGHYNFKSQTTIEQKLLALIHLLFGITIFAGAILYQFVT